MAMADETGRGMEAAASAALLHTVPPPAAPPAPGVEALRAWRGLPGPAVEPVALPPGSVAIHEQPALHAGGARFATSLPRQRLVLVALLTAMAGGTAAYACLASGGGSGHGGGAAAEAPDLVATAGLGHNGPKTVHFEELAEKADAVLAFAFALDEAPPTEGTQPEPEARTPAARSAGVSAGMPSLRGGPLPQLRDLLRRPESKRADKAGSREMKEDAVDSAEISEAERDMREDQFDHSACIGNTVQTAFWTAALGLKLTDATKTCNINRVLRLERNPRWNGKIVRPIRRLLGRPALPLVASNFTAMNDTSAILDRFRTLAVNWKTTVATVKAKRIRIRDQSSLCARDVTEMMGNVARIAALLEAAAFFCAPRGKKPNTKCAVSVSNALVAMFEVSRQGAECQTACPGSADQGWSDCGSKLESIAWNTNGFIVRVTDSVRFCANPVGGAPVVDYGACVGSLMCSGLYMAATGLYISQAAQTDCPSQFTVPRPPTGATKRQIKDNEVRRDTFRINCGRDITAGLRTMSLSSWFFLQGAGFCGNFDTKCGVNMLQSVTGFLTATQSIDMARVNCAVAPRRSGLTKKNVRDFNARCSGLISSAVKDRLLAANACALLGAAWMCIILFMLVAFTQLLEVPDMQCMPGLQCGGGFHHGGVRGLREDEVCQHHLRELGLQGFGRRGLDERAVRLHECGLRAGPAAVLQLRPGATPQFIPPLP